MSKNILSEEVKSAIATQRARIIQYLQDGGTLPN